MQWATDMLQPGVAVVVGIAIPAGSTAATEVAVLDTAGRVHAHDSVDSTRSWALAVLAQASTTRFLLAYNAPNVRDWLLFEADRGGFGIGRLADPGRWGCIMRARSVALGTPDRLYPLGTARGAVAAAGRALTIVDDIARQRCVATRVGADVRRDVPG